MESYKWQVETHSFTDNTPYGQVNFANLIATLPVGKYAAVNDSSTLNRVVFACHYDSKYFKDIEFVAATDSAVPCAMLLDMAKFLHENIDLAQFKNVILKFI